MNAIPPRRRRAQPLALAGLLLFAGQAQAATFVVTNRFDAGTGGCTAAECTLREAIVAANATATADFINFSFRAAAGAEILIQPATPLPTLTQPVTIDGYSASGTQVNTLGEGSNAVLRIRLDGSNAGATANGFAICADDVAIKGLSITGFQARAIAFSTQSNGASCASAHSGAVITGNFLGLRVDGTSVAGNGTGIFLSRMVARIGGPLPAERNLIAGNNGAGIQVVNPFSVGSRIEGNLIGTDKSGTLDLGNGGAGVELNIDATGIDIGTTSAPNLIAHNGAGIRTSVTAGVANTWYANRFVDNVGLGIDLRDDGVTPNDDNDTDTGPNNRQNFPVIDSASRTAGGVTTGMTLEVGNATSQTYRIALYASSQCDASGHGEGERLLSDQSRSLSNGTQSFTLSATTTEPLPIGSMLTATATALDGSSSEFSLCFPLDPPPLVVNSVTDPGSGGCTVAECTLREAIAAASAGSVGSIHSIEFGIDGPGPHVIAPTTPLPTITRTTSIDGYSQPGASPNTLADGSDAVLLIRIDGVDAGPAASGLAVCGTDAEQTEIRGLSITRFAQHGLSLAGRSDGSFCADEPVDLRVTGNLIGLTPGGIAAGNSIGIRAATRVAIGGPAPGDRNVVSSNGSGIVVIDAAATGTQVTGNFVGLDPGGTLARGNTTEGITVVSGTVQVDIGGAAPNRIAFNRSGILVLGSTTQARISGNRVHSNTALGIDLSTSAGGLPDGVTPNDVDDGDAGPNGLLNFPVLSLAQRSEAGIRIAGQVDAPPGFTGNYLIAVYANAACDASGFGEGERFLGTFDVALTFGAGEEFSVELPTDDPLPAGTGISVNATLAGSSSEFSQCILATDPPPGFVVTSTADTDGATCGATCTLRQAINAANAMPGADQISFAITGDGPFTISPASELPALTDAVTIDGYSQLGAAPNTATTGSNAVLQIRIDGGGSLAHGLKTCADEVVLRGLSLTRFIDRTIATRINDAGNCALNGAAVAIVGNFIGLPPDGTATVGSSVGILVAATQARIGGESLADRNLITQQAIGISVVLPASAGTQVLNNVFGTDPSGTLPRGNPGVAAVTFDQGATGVTLGSPTAPNLFRFNTRAVLMRSTSHGNRLYANQFQEQASTPIDLSATGSIDGTTANDADDADSGGNNLQNFPVLGSGVAFGDSLTINGVLDVPAATSNAPYTIALYENAVCHSSGFGEGEIFLGAQVVNLSGNAEGFSVTLPVTPPAPGRLVTATATDPLGNTSEFSACLAAPVILTIFADGFEG